MAEGVLARFVPGANLNTAAQVVNVPINIHNTAARTNVLFVLNEDLVFVALNQSQENAKSMVQAD